MAKSRLPARTARARKACRSETEAAAKELGPTNLANCLGPRRAVLVPIDVVVALVVMSCNSHCYLRHYYYRY